MGDSVDVFQRLYSRVGHLISTRRKALGLTQTQLAQRVGVSQSAVSGWENGKDLPKDLLALAKVLDVTQERLQAVIAAAALSNDKVEQAIREQSLLSSEIQDALVAIYRDLLIAASQKKVVTGGAG